MKRKTHCDREPPTSTFSEFSGRLENGGGKVRETGKRVKQGGRLGGDEEKRRFVGEKREKRAGWKILDVEGITVPTTNIHQKM